MNLKVIEEHTFDLDLLNKQYPVLDVGCRFFNLIGPFKNLGLAVISIDADPALKPLDPMTEYMNVALATSQGSLDFAVFGNGTGNYLITDKQPNQGHPVVKVRTIDIKTLMSHYSIEKFSAVKLDCEGAEYDILMNWPGPIANQISVEFHEHILLQPHSDEYYKKLVNHLSQWYEAPVNFIKEKRHCLATPNYWDVLFRIKSQHGTVSI